MNEIRPIDANELKDSIVENIRELGDQCSPVMLTMFGLFSDIIDNAPTVEPERPKGTWEPVKGDYFTPGGDGVLICPFCHSKESQHIGGVEFPIHWDFCPTCGADMRGCKENEECTKG